MAGEVSVISRGTGEAGRWLMSYSSPNMGTPHTHSQVTSTGQLVNWDLYVTLSIVTGVGSNGVKTLIFVNIKLHIGY